MVELLLSFRKSNLEDLIIVFCKVDVDISLDQVRKVVKVFPVVIGKNNCLYTSSLGSNHLKKINKSGGNTKRSLKNVIAVGNLFFDATNR